MNHAWASRQTSKLKGESELATRSMSSTSETTISYVIYIRENQAMSSIREQQSMLYTHENQTTSAIRGNQTMSYIRGNQSMSYIRGTILHVIHNFMLSLEVSDRPYRG